METVALINGVIALIQLLEPKIEEAIKKGEISPEEQQRLADKIGRLRSHVAFTGPHWQPSDRPQ